jgi:putative ABC transport system substrate-binding protein
VKRREFITLLGGTAAAWPLAASAQKPAMPVIGYLSSLGQTISVRLDAAFRRGLSDIGYFEGQDVSANTAGLPTVMRPCRQWQLISCSAK